MNSLPSDSHSPMNHVFVDYENVHEVDVAIFDKKPVSLTLLMGAMQTKLDASLVEKLIEHAASVQLVRLESSGKNALDFTLAYYVGRAVITDPSGYFHIVSKDTGYDPLIDHLKKRKIRAQRHDDFSSLTFSVPPKVAALPPPPISTASTAAVSATSSVAPADELLVNVLDHLRKNPNNRPKRQKTLLSHLKAFAGKSATEEDAAALIEQLKKAKHLSIDPKGAVKYHLK